MLMKRWSLRSTGGEALASPHRPDVLASTIRALLDVPPAPSEVVTDAEIESARSKPPPGVPPVTEPPLLELQAAAKVTRAQARTRMRATRASDAPRGDRTLPRAWRTPAGVEPFPCGGFPRYVALRMQLLRA